MAEEEKLYRFPVLVKGKDGNVNISKKLKNRLMCYFLSPKKSGGGECKICEEAVKKQQIVIYFAEENVRERVLGMQSHEIDMPDNKKIKLSVSLPAVENEPVGDLSSSLVKESTAVKETDESSCPENMPGEVVVQEELSTVVVLAEGEEIEDDIVEMYFENKKRSGGGPIKSCAKDGKQFIITFENRADAQEVLQRKDHTVKNTTFHVKQFQQRVTQDEPQASASLVLLENVQETTEECMLILLVENVSGLSEEEQRFSVEMVPDSNAAAITFFQATDINEFIQAFNTYHRARQLNISARSLEVTNSILVENIPPDLSENFITVCFESKKHGGGPILDTKYVAEDNTAIITFQDSKDAANVLKHKHFLNSVPIHVYPYYVSLGAALYGKEKPQIKIPDPRKVPLDPYLWQFLGQNQPLLQEISHAMSSCHCEVEWPTGHCAHPEIILHPSRALSKQKRSLVKTWKEDVSTRFTQILSKQKVVECGMSTEVWEAIRNAIIKDDILVIPDIPKGIVVLVGPAEAVAHTELEMNILVRKAEERIEKEKQTVEETLSVVSGKYTILNNAGLKGSICPDLKIEYDGSKELVILRGVAAEVFKIKSVILERLSNMIQEYIQIHPYILTFLQFVDNVCLSQLLFWAKKINAFYALQEEKVLLIAESPQVIQRAAEEMKKELTYVCIELEDTSVIRKEGWNELTNSLYKMHNCSSETVIIQELEDQVVIAGCSREVSSTHMKLSDFINSNTHIEKNIKTKSAAVTMYMQKEKYKSWHELEQQGVVISFGTATSPRLISLQGPRVPVLKGLDLFRKILSSLYAASMVLDKPGAKAFFKEREHFYVPTIKQQFNCLIRIQEDGEEEDVPDRNRSEEKKQLWGKVNLKDGIVIAVHKADLTCFPVDVVVNASNDELKHIGGLASALLEAAGPQLQIECNALVKKQGRVQPGCAVITNSGKLPCKQVIHVVGPRWRQAEKEECVQLLKKAVRESLHLAERYKYRSIAIPAISSGVFGFPIKESAFSIVRAIKETVEESFMGDYLKEIYLVDVKEDTIQEFSQALNEEFRPVFLSPELPSASSTKSHTTKNGAVPEEMTTAEGLRIVLQKKGIEDSTTDVIVNSVGKDLKLDSGFLSKALLAKAGAELQEELIKRGKEKHIKEGSVLKTNGYALVCSYVLHAILPAWNQSQQSQNKILGDIVKECLKMSEDLHQKSITIPAMGTGNLRFPKPFVAKLMFDEVTRFSQQENPQSIQEVHFVLHPSDTESIKAFMDELKSRLNFGQTSPSVSGTVTENAQQQDRAFFGRISSLQSGVHQMQIGSILLQVGSGDITQETTDAIVNITNSTFSLKHGVSKAILERAGAEVEKECNDLASQPHNQLICTQAGKLGCKNVIHLAAHDDTKAQVSKALMECEQRQFTSVAFPAIGTGRAGRDPVVAADNMIDAISDFAMKTPSPILKNIKIIIFQPHLLSVFHKSMERNEVTAVKCASKPAKSLFIKIAELLKLKKPDEEVKPSVVLERPVEPTVFQICGESQKQVEDAQAWVKKQILTGQNEISLSDEWIWRFEESDYDILRDLQRKLHVVIQLEQGSSSPSLHVFGISNDVLKACGEIQKIIKRVRERQEEQSKAEILGNLVEWQYEDNGQYRAFDHQVNMQLEFAAHHQRLHEVTIHDKHYKVDPSKLCAVDNLGASITLRRISKAEDQLAMALPEEWENMGQMRVKLVPLQPGMKEYQDIATMFNQTCNSYTIEKIERVQNPYIWQAYQVKKQEMDAKNGNKNNERRLFHGTASTSLTHINNSGFNRSYAGLHAAMYGNGTYFAVNASYSAQNTYSSPDANGTKYMYLARVLVGEYSVGSKGLIVPHSKGSTDPTDLFDSVTDNMAKPSLFVIFNDIQAYPEYLITFRK